MAILTTAQSAPRLTITEPVVVFCDLNDKCVVGNRSQETPRSEQNGIPGMFRDRDNVATVHLLDCEHVAMRLFVDSGVEVDVRLSRWVDSNSEEIDTGSRDRRQFAQFPRLPPSRPSPETNQEQGGWEDLGADEKGEIAGAHCVLL